VAALVQFRGVAKPSGAHHADDGIAAPSAGVLKAEGPPASWSGEGQQWIGDAISEGLRSRGFAYVRAGPGLSDESLMQLLGHLGGPFHAGFPVMKIFPAPQPRGIAETSMGLEFHHECAYMQEPPRVVALYCRQNLATGGRLLLCDTGGVLAGLSASVLESMRATPFLNTVLPNNTAMPLIRPMPRLQGEERFSFSAIGMNRSQLYFQPAPGFEAPGAKILEALRPVLADCPGRHEIEWHPGDLVVIDNMRVMHGRFGFEGAGRELAHIRLA